MPENPPDPKTSPSVLLEDIQARSDHSNALHRTFCDEAMSNARRNDLRTCIAHDAITLTLEFHGAISLLTRFAHYAAAHALIRPLNESCARTLWLIYAADSQSVMQLSMGERTQDLEWIARRLMRKEQDKEIQDLGRFLGPSGKIFNSFTHGGFEQLRRRESGYWPTEVLGSLGFADFVANIAVRCSAMINADEPLQQRSAERARTLADEVAGIFGWTPPPAHWNGRLPDYPDWPKLARHDVLGEDTSSNE